MGVFPSGGPSRGLRADDRFDVRQGAEAVAVRAGDVGVDLLSVVVSVADEASPPQAADRIPVVRGGVVYWLPFSGAQGVPGGQGHVGTAPPDPLHPGMIWLMTPDDHVAIFSSLSGWLPLYPQVGNQAVVTGNTLAELAGLWTPS